MGMMNSPDPQAKSGKHLQSSRYRGFEGVGVLPGG